MNRRNFFMGSVAALGGALLVGKDGTYQLPIEKEKIKEETKASVRIDEYGIFIFPGFFTVFVDGKEAFRMLVGESIIVERNCHIVAFNGFESSPSMDIYMFEGDSLEVS